jgi:hypothetical protein
MPYIYIPERQKISPTEGTDVEMNCQLLFGGDVNVTWLWLVNEVPLNSSSRVVITTINSPPSLFQTRLSIREIALNQRGTYQCIATNSFGNYTQTIQVNVRNMLSPLWPFIGVLVEAAAFLACLFGCDKTIDKKLKKRRA